MEVVGEHKRIAWVIVAKYAWIFFRDCEGRRPWGGLSRRRNPPLCFRPDCQFTAVALLLFFGTLLGSLLPTVDARVSWQSHICGFLAGVFVGWLLHPRKGSARTRRPPVG